jgi:hypothetical protein
MTSDTPIAKWSYRGMDTTAGVRQVDLNHDTCLPALVVWITMTTNPGYQSSGPATMTEILSLSDSLRLTEPCIAYLLGMRTTAIPAKIPADPNNPAIDAVTVAAAFVTVARAFHNVGVGIAPKVGDPVGAFYEPENCPLVNDLAILANAAGLAIIP